MCLTGGEEDGTEFWDGPMRPTVMACSCAAGDLCHPLNCKKKELCLLEDAFTAVCVSKKELHKNG
jgi:hypothetical protein